MPDDGKKIEIDGPVEIVIGKKEEKKKAVTIPTKCKDGEKIVYPEPPEGVAKFFIDESNRSTQEGLLKSISTSVKTIPYEEYLNICTNITMEAVCNSIIPTPIHCGKPMIIIKEANGKATLKCDICKISSKIEKLRCPNCKQIVVVSALSSQTKEKKIERIVVELNGSTENKTHLCPEGNTFKDLKLALYKTSKGKPSGLLEYDEDGDLVPSRKKENDGSTNSENSDENENNGELNSENPKKKKIYVKFKQFNHKTGKKEVRTSRVIGNIKLLKYNRSWEIPPLGLPKGTVRSILLLMVFWMFIGFFLPETDKAFHPIQVEVLILLIVVFIPSLLDKLDIKDDYKTGGKLTFLGGAGIFGWLTFQEFFEANTFNLMIAPLFVLVGIALRKAVNEVISNHPESELKNIIVKWADHILSLVVIVYVGGYMYYNLEIGIENIPDIWHIIFAILTSFYVSERLFEQDVKIKATYYPEKAVTPTV